MNFEHVMVDLETLSAQSDAVILSIGAVRFDLDKLQLSHNRDFYVTVNANDCQRRGLQIDYDTVCWWMRQSESARKIFDLAGIPLDVALLQFAEYVKAVPESIIWGNGATFDNMILRNAFKVAGMVDYPVSYRNDFCFRTLHRLFPVDKVAFSGTQHNALHDARYQAETVLRIWSKYAPRGLTD